jgi:3'(2'), 5'-bisphosphate nucleotidase
MSQPPSDDIAPMRSTDDHSLAAHIAERAGALLLTVREQAGPASGTAPDTYEKLGIPEAERKSLGADGDRRAHELIVAALRAERPEDAVLSEEGVQPGAGGTVARDHGQRRIWIVDPLDGTREFSEGRSDFAVHVALVDNGVAIVGAVALPGEGLVLTTGSPPTLPPPTAGRPRMLVSRTRPAAEATMVAERLGAELVPMGSAGAKAMAVVRGEGDIYLHSGGQYEWDSAAPVAVALAAGLHATRLDGSPLVYDQTDPWLPDLLICRPELAADVLLLLGTAP